MIDDKEKMIGMILRGAPEVSEDKETLTFSILGGITATFQAYGDCCSHTWIEHITVPTDVIDQPIIGVSDNHMGSHEEDYDTIQVYQSVWATPVGEIIVEFRNSSNGYYGGSLEGPDFMIRE
jgi:hypothetical protein